METENQTAPMDVNEMDFEEKVLLSWESAERLHKARGKDFYSTMVVLAVLVSIIMFFIEGLIPVLVVWTIVFVTWVMSKTPPQKIEHQITSLGIRTSNELYRFNEMMFFWVEEKWGEKILKIAITRRFPTQLSILIKVEDDLKIRKILVDNSVFLQKPVPNLLDKITKWVGEKVPLE